jgi:hypothetical protein
MGKAMGGELFWGLGFDALFRHGDLQEKPRLLQY